MWVYLIKPMWFIHNNDKSKNILHLYVLFSKRLYIHDLNLNIQQANESKWIHNGHFLFCLPSIHLLFLWYRTLDFPWWKIPTLFLFRVIQVALTPAPARQWSYDGCLAYQSTTFSGLRWLIQGWAPDPKRNRILGLLWNCCKDKITHFWWSCCDIRL